MNSPAITDVLTSLSAPQGGVSELESAVSQRLEQRDFLAKMWGLFPTAQTLDDLLEKIKGAMALKVAVDAMTTEGLSPGDTRARLTAMGLLPKGLV